MYSKVPLPLLRVTEITTFLCYLSLTVSYKWCFFYVTWALSSISKCWRQFLSVHRHYIGSIVPFAMPIIAFWQCVVSLATCANCTVVCTLYTVYGVNHLTRLVDFLQLYHAITLIVRDYLLCYYLFLNVHNV